MRNLTNEAENAIQSEVEAYKKFIRNRSQFYAEIDDNVVVNETHVHRAARDFKSDNDYTFENRRSSPSLELLVAFLVFVCMGAMVSIMFYEWDKMMEEVSVFALVFLLVSSIMGVVISMGIRAIKVIRRRRSDGEVRIAEYLNEWMELELMLVHLYEKSKGNEPGTISELMVFYMDLPEIQRQGKDIEILKLLKYRNDIIHKNVKSITIRDLDTSIRSIKDIKSILKRIEIKVPSLDF